MSAPVIVYSEFAVKCECGHIATFKNAHMVEASGVSCSGCGRLVGIAVGPIEIEVGP